MLAAAAIYRVEVDSLRRHGRVRKPLLTLRIVASQS